MSEENNAKLNEQGNIDNPGQSDSGMFTEDNYPRMGKAKSGTGCRSGCGVFALSVVGVFLLIILIASLSDKIRDWKKDKQESKEKEAFERTLEWSLKQYYGIERRDYTYTGEISPRYPGYRVTFKINGQIYEAQTDKDGQLETNYLVDKFRDGLREQLLENIRESNLFPGFSRAEVRFSFSLLPAWVTEIEIADYLDGKTNLMDKWKAVNTYLTVDFYSYDETVYGVIPSAAVFYDELKLGEIGLNLTQFTVSCNDLSGPEPREDMTLARKTFLIPDDVTKAREEYAGQEPVRERFRYDFLKMKKAEYGIADSEVKISDITLSEDLAHVCVKFLYKNKEYEAYYSGTTEECESGWWTNLYYETFIGAAQKYLYQKTGGSGLFSDYNGIAVSARSSKVISGFGERKVLPSWVDGGKIADCFKAGTDRLNWRLIEVVYEINVYAESGNDFKKSWKHFVPNTADAACTMKMRCLNGYLGEPGKATLLGSSADLAPDDRTPVCYDFNGATVTILDWWSGEDWRTPVNAYHEVFFDKLFEAENLYGFKLNRKNLTAGTEGSYLEALALSIQNNTPEGQIVTFEDSQVTAYLRAGLLADVSKTGSVDWNDEKWNAQVKQIMTVNGGTYGFAANQFDTMAGIVVFFNPDVFTKLNISPDLPYDLQKEGKWNWEEFTKLCSRLSCDTDNDGKNDIYAVSGLSENLAFAALLSNDTSVIGKESESGLLKTNADDPKVKEAMNFIKMLHDEEYMVPAPGADNYSWNWPEQAFYECRTAMYIDKEQTGTTKIRANAPDMKAGFVCFPYGPSAPGPVAVLSSYIMAIPACESVKDDDIEIALKVYDIYTTVPEEYIGDNADWRSRYNWKYEDKRAVDETIGNIMVHYVQRMNPGMLIPGYDSERWTEDLQNGKDVDAILNEWTPKWSAEVEDFNARFR